MTRRRPPLCLQGGCIRAEKDESEQHRERCNGEFERVVQRFRITPTLDLPRRCGTEKLGPENRNDHRPGEDFELVNEARGQLSNPGSEGTPPGHPGFANALVFGWRCRGCHRETVTVWVSPDRRRDRLDRAVTAAATEGEQPAAASAP